MRVSIETLLKATRKLLINRKGLHLKQGSLKRILPPFGWIGGKSKLARDIVGLMPKHRLYVEVFGGALNVLYTKPKEMCKYEGEKKPYAEVVNDINGELINLHKIIKNRPESLNSFLNTLPISRELFYDIRDGRILPKSDIERAGYYYYLITQSFGSTARTFAMATKTRKPKNLYRDFKVFSERLKMVTIENMSFEKLLKEYDVQDSFFYCDPPYYQTEKYYSNTGGFVEDKHIELRDSLNSICLSSTNPPVFE